MRTRDKILDFRNTYILFLRKEIIQEIIIITIITTTATTAL